MFQMEIPQVALFRQLAYDVAWGFTFCFSAQNRGILCSLTRVFGYLLFQCGSWVLPTGGPFLLRTGAVGSGLFVISNWVTSFLSRFPP